MALYTKQQAREGIGDLVAAFRVNEASLATVPEAQIELNYIRPLFQFLNWDPRGAGLHVADLEFLVQKVDRKGKTPDYLLRLDGQDLLVMDAKRVEHDMADPRWMNQAYSYAYSTQDLSASRRIDFAILTDFQEFILLDCTLYAAEPAAIANFRILDWTYEDYLTEFDTLWDLFERENVRAAAKTRTTSSPTGLWSRYLSPKKVKANRVPPNKAFLGEMDDEKTGWRVTLARDMKKRNPQADGPLITAAVQLLIDRLIFVKVLSDREIEDDYLTQLAETIERAGLAESDTDWFTACRSLFARLNQFYNGSVFESRPELEGVTVSNAAVRSVLYHLLPENSPYNFAVLPIEILGTIYERFLGRVVRTTDHRVKIESKPEVRKAGGIYYTPQYIVDYIVQNTVGVRLEACKTPQDVERLKVLDPACGSGSFLVGAYSAIIQWYIRYFTEKTRLTKVDRAVAYRDSDGRIRLTARLKRQILLSNLYGADIDQQAVEVTRFSLSLKALEDTRRGELAEERNLFHQTVLPDLSTNIKSGNSLVGNDYSADPQDRVAVQAFEWKVEFQSVMSRGGFDVALGNPPWLMSGYYVKDILGYLRNTYRSAKGKFDQYYVFLERAIQLLSPTGTIGMIVPNKFFHTRAARELRALLSDGRWIRRVIDFGTERIFEGATNYSCIVILGKEPVGEPLYATARAGLRLTDEYEVPWSSFAREGWNFGDEPTRSLFMKLESVGEPLEQLITRFGAGVQSGADRVLTLEPGKAKSENLEGAVLTPLLRGRDVRRYSIADAEKVLIFPYEVKDGEFVILPEERLREHPNAYRLLLQARGQLAKRVWFGKGAQELSGEWYGMMYLDSRAAFTEPHILTPSLSDKANFTLGDGRLFATGTAGVTSITPKRTLPESILYLLGVLNSSVVSYYVVGHSPAFQGGYFKFTGPYLRRAPIRRIDFADAGDKRRHDRITALVTRLTEMHETLRGALATSERIPLLRQITATDQEIDEIVYELYGLTPEDIAMVQAKSLRSGGETLDKTAGEQSEVSRVV